MAGVLEAAFSRANFKAFLFLAYSENLMQKIQWFVRTFFCAAWLTQRPAKVPHRLATYQQNMSLSLEAGHDFPLVKQDEYHLLVSRQIESLL